MHEKFGCWLIKTIKIIINQEVRFMQLLKTKFDVEISCFIVRCCKN